MERKLLELFKKQCKEIKLPKKRLRKDCLLMIGYAYGFFDAIKKNSA